jgi:hypothetical protein
MELRKLMRTARDTIFSLAVAVMGTSIAEGPFLLFSRSQTTADLYQRELLVTGSVAFVLGVLVYAKWRSEPALWIWLPGLAGFGWWALLGGQSPSLYEDVNKMVLAFVSLRMVGYSTGALLCAMWLKPAPAVVASDQAPSE